MKRLFKVLFFCLGIFIYAESSANIEEDFISAIYNDDAKAVEFYIDNGIDVNKSIMVKDLDFLRNIVGPTSEPIEIFPVKVAWNKRYESLRILLNNKVDINGENSYIGLQISFPDSYTYDSLIDFNYEVDNFDLSDLFVYPDYSLMYDAKEKLSSLKETIRLVKKHLNKKIKLVDEYYFFDFDFDSKDINSTSLELLDILVKNDISAKKIIKAYDAHSVNPDNMFSEEVRYEKSFLFNKPLILKKLIDSGYKFDLPILNHVIDNNVVKFNQEFNKITMLEKEDKIKTILSLSSALNRDAIIVNMIKKYPEKYSDFLIKLGIDTSNKELLELLKKNGINLNSFYYETSINEAGKEIKTTNKVYYANLAIIKGDNSIIDLFLDNKDISNIDNEKLLFIGIYNSNRNHVELAIKNDVNIDVENSIGDTPYLFAAKYGNLELMKYFEKLGNDIHKTNSNGVNALIYSTYYGYKDVFNYSLEKEIDMEAEDQGGDTPLLNSILYQNNDFVKVLIEKGANLNHKNSEGFNAFSYAIKAKNYDVLELLMNNGADISLGTKTNIIGLALVNRDKKLLDFLISKGFKISDAIIDNEELWKKWEDGMISKLFDFYKTNNNNNFEPYVFEGATAIEDYIVQKNDLELLEFIIENKYPININFLINEALDKEKIVIIGILSKNNFITSQSEKVYKLASKYSLIGIIKDLIKFNKISINDELVNFLLKNNQIDLLEKLLFSIKKSNEFSEELINWSLQQKNNKYIEYILSLGLNINNVDENGNSLLIRAAINNNQDMIDYLINKGADISLKGENNKSILSFTNSSKIRQFLISKGAKW